MAAERETVDRLIAAYLAERVDQRHFDGRISGRHQVGTICPIAGVSARTASSPYLRSATIIIIFDEAARALFGSQSGKGYQLATMSR